MRYNYIETKKELMDLRIENPNPLSIQYITGLKSMIKISHNLNLSDKEVLEIHNLFEEAKEVRIPRDLGGTGVMSFTMFNGKIEKFNQSGSDFIKAMTGESPELRIRIMFLKEEDMEIYIEDARKHKAKEFSEFFKNKDYESRELGEPVDWDDLFQNFYDLYNLPKTTTPTKIVNDIKSGKIKLAAASELMETMLNEVFIREKE